MVFRDDYSGMVIQCVIVFPVFFHICHNVSSSESVGSVVFLHLSSTLHEHASYRPDLDWSKSNCLETVTCD